MIKNPIDRFMAMSKRKRRICVLASAALVFILAVYLILYCNGYSGAHTRARYHEGQIKVACVGDSITYGHGIKGWARNNYPAQLGKILGDGYHVQNFGHSGKTVSNNGDQPYTDSKWYVKGLEYDADILVIMLGTNDSKPENWTNVEDFINEYDSLIEEYKKNNPDLRVIICTPAAAFLKDGGSAQTTNFDIQPKVVEAIRNRIRVYALARGYELVDVYDLTQYHREWFSDNVHPSGEGARAIAELIAKKIR